MSAVFGSVNDTDLVTRACFSLFKNDCKNAFPRHDAVTGLLSDRTIGVAFLADLGHFTQGGPDLKSCTNRERCESDPLTENVFRESAGNQAD